MWDLTFDPRASTIQHMWIWEGVVWQTRNIAESAATMSIFTMIFAVALSVVKVVQAPAVTAQKSPAARAQSSGIF